MGRKKTLELSDRPIDLDIIFYEDLVLTSEILNIPHPRATERAFVIIPACEIDPNFTDPLSGKTLREIMERQKELFQAQNLRKIILEERL